MAQVNITVAAGKKVVVTRNGETQTYVATDTLDVDAHEAKRLIDQGLATETE